MIGKNNNCLPVFENKIITFVEERSRKFRFEEEGIREGEDRAIQKARRR